MIHVCDYGRNGAVAGLPCFVPCRGQRAVVVETAATSFQGPRGATTEAQKLSKSVDDWDDYEANPDHHAA